jgi:F0F1-type ATP synthase epsilon subunit
MGHSSDVHKLILSDDGIALVPVDAAAVPSQKAKVDKSISEKQTMSKTSDGKLGILTGHGNITS